MLKTRNFNLEILCISTYLLTKVENDRYEEYSECIDQIFEIIQKYQNSHEIVIGGDFNEDISKNMYLIIIQLNLSLSVR